MLGHHTRRGLDHDPGPGCCPFARGFRTALVRTETAPADTVSESVETTPGWRKKSVKVLERHCGGSAVARGRIRDLVPLRMRSGRHA
jgi:uncharacterized protein CbrC (UPF0167 family)